jgi:carboxypeptidase Taq
VSADLRTLRERLAEISDIQRSVALLFWDQRVTMPPLGSPARAEAVATLGRIAHDRFVDDEIGLLLERLRPLEESLEHDSDDASLIRVTRRLGEGATRPPSFARSLRAASAGHLRGSRRAGTDDFRGLSARARAELELKKRYVECFSGTTRRTPPSSTTSSPFQGRPRSPRCSTPSPVLGARARGPGRRRLVPPRSLPEDLQREFGQRVAETVGFTDGAWRIDPTAHPFCVSFSTRDVRLTTHYDATGLHSLWSTLHEAGHGLYAHGISPTLERTPLANAPSLGLNESQSRTWENLVGRSQPFWTHWYEPLQATFPDQLGTVGLDDFVAAINRAKPGLIRVDADETTYSLHIILRFDLERQLIEERLAPKDVPEAWNEGMRELLGVEVPNDANGVLQDVHWSSGGIGYFPTYALGNVISLQLWSVVRDAIPDLDAQMEAGELLELSAWLRDHLYSLGRKLTPKETIERLTGSPTIDPQPYLAYLRDKLAALPAGA